jgi:uracil-DNA glycosylase
MPTPTSKRPTIAIARKEPPTAAAFVPDNPTLPKLRSAASACRGCELWKSAKQTVFGEGSSHAKVMLIGEQPGDQEDQLGHPFVGPAGRLLDEVLAKAGLARDEIYVTNVVKHFKWEPRGKRRIHKKPRYSEIVACRPWLDWEIKLVRPKAVVCLGATAAQALLGPKFRVTQRRGQWVKSPLAKYVMATVHPSSILRAPDHETRQAETERFVQDLSNLASVVAGGRN